MRREYFSSIIPLLPYIFSTEINPLVFVWNKLPLRAHWNFLGTGSCTIYCQIYTRKCLEFGANIQVLNAQGTQLKLRDPARNSFSFLVVENIFYILPFPSKNLFYFLYFQTLGYMGQNIALSFKHRELKPPTQQR